MCCLINNVYKHSFKSIIETTEKFKQYSGNFLGVGAFEQLFGPVRGEFEQKFFQNFKSPWGCPGGDVEVSI